jgi:CspA family cold shock protein
MKTGVVKFYNEAKGFGFITEEGTGQDIFAHASGLKEQIRESDSVQFEVVDGKKGKNAVEVTVA